MKRAFASAIVGLAAAATGSAASQEMREVELLRGTSAVCTLDIEDGSYHYRYEGRYDRSSGRLVNTSSRLYLRLKASEIRRSKNYVRIAERPYIERVYSATGGSRRTVFRIEKAQGEGITTNSRMVLTNGTQSVARSIMSPFPIFAPGTVKLDFDETARAIFDTPFTLSYYNRDGGNYYEAKFVPDPAYEASRGTGLIAAAEKRFVGLPAAAAQLPKACVVDRRG